MVQHGFQCITRSAVLHIAIFTSNASAKHAHSIPSPAKARKNCTTLFVVADHSGIQLSRNVRVEAHATLIHISCTGIGGRSSCKIQWNLPSNTCLMNFHAYFHVLIRRWSSTRERGEILNQLSHILTSLNSRYYQSVIHSNGLIVSCIFTFNSLKKYIYSRLIS